MRLPTLLPQRRGAHLVAAVIGLVLLLSLSGHSVTASTAEPSAVNENPARAFGYVLGDLLVQRVSVGGTDDVPELAGFAEPVRVDQWLERRSVTLTPGQGDTSWLSVTYQIINVPRRVTRTRTPALSIAREGGAPVTIASWPFTLGPLIGPAEGGDSSDSLQADRPPALPDSDALLYRLRASGLLLGVVLLGWFGWWRWREHRDRHVLPFASAHAEVRRARGNTRSAGADPAAWMALHRALDRSAGRSVQAGSVDVLIRRQPWLLPLREQIEHFFVASSARFFEQPPRTQDFPLLTFSESLRQAERRQAG